MALRALLIGINKYHPDSEVPSLNGCVNDIIRVQDFLTRLYADQLSDPGLIRVLTNEQATRTNVIDAFRSHLGEAGPTDQVLIYYAGHGAQNATAKEFETMVTGNKDEGWVLYDSRTEGQYDLADKEIALLLEAVGKTGATITFISDSCHSGSVTRDAEGPVARTIEGRTEPRPLETYLDGAYLNRAGQLKVPHTPHFLLAACDKTERAFEVNGSGFFTKALLAALDPFGGSLTYSELYTRSCAFIRRSTFGQNPQAEPVGGFNPRSGFLGKNIPPDRATRYEVFCDQDKTWQIKLGAVHGLRSDMDKSLEIKLYDAPVEGTARGRVRIRRIDATSSVLDIGDLLLTENTYYAEPLKLPLPPLVVYCPELEAVPVLKAAWEARGESPVFFQNEPDGAAVALRAENGNFVLYPVDTNAQIHGVKGQDETAADYILGILERIAHWERVRKLDNPRPVFDRSKAPMRFLLQGENIPETKAKVIFKGQPVDFKLEYENQLEYPLNFTLVYLDENFGITILGESLRLNPGEQKTFEDHFELPDGVDKARDIFKLIVSTIRIDEIMLSQKALKPNIVSPFGDDTRALSSQLPPPFDWFAHTLEVQTVRENTDAARGQKP